MERFPVMIVGGGPVGLSAAILLARHGIRCLLVERKAGTTNHPKARAINVRTMELVRQWGIEDALCEHTLPQEFWRFMWCTTLSGAEIARVNDPSGEWTDKSPTARRIVAQDAVEAVLYDYAKTLPLITVRFSTELRSFRQTDTGVVAQVVSRAPTATNGEENLDAIEARYLLAADGATSAVRRTLGIAMEGPEALSHQASIYFRADLRPWMAHRPADIYYCTDGIWLAVVNGTKRWLGIMRYDPETGLRREDFTPAFCTEQIRRSVGVPDLPVEIINTSFWTMAAQVAARFRQERIFLVGDAAHRMAPTGGFGLNTGVQDAHNLAWKLAAVLNGHAGPALLDTYETERKPVATSNATWSAENAQRIWDIITAAQAGEHENIRIWAAEQQNHICSEGRALGFQYTSEAVVPDGTPAPAFSSQTYHPSARPGSRAPHCWLLQGTTRRSTLDLFDHHFVLLTAAPGDPWRATAQALEGPMRSYLKVFTIGPKGDLQDPTNDWLKLYDLDADGAVLVRPDGHVAWRRRQLATDPAATLADVMNRLLRPLVLV